MTWDVVRDKAKNLRLDRSGEKSDFNSLMQIIDKLERLGVDPEDAEKASLSNLREIVPILRDALKNNDLTSAREVLATAADLSNRELRIQLGVPGLETIFYEVIEEEGEKMIQVAFTPKQFERLKKATTIQFEFKEKKLD